LRHSSLRVTIERAFSALNNRFKVVDQKPFHTYEAQVKLVLTSFILHNWTLAWGEYDYFPHTVVPGEAETSYGVDQGDSEV
jgi:hypothetical protein